MGNDRSAAPTNILRQSDPGSIYLGIACLPTQLLDDFNDLINTGSADGMAAGFQAATGADWNFSTRSNLPLNCKPWGLAALNKSTGF